MTRKKKEVKRKPPKKQAPKKKVAKKSSVKKPVTKKKLPKKAKVARATRSGKAASPAKPAEAARRAAKTTKPAKKTAKPKEPPKTSSPEPPEPAPPSPHEEEILQKRLAALRAEAEKRRQEEEKLKEKIAAIREEVQIRGQTLSGQKISQELGARIKAHLKAFWEVPVILEDRTDLRAEVEVRVAPDGHIVFWRFLRKSGDPLFDEAVRATLKKADPLPAPGTTLILNTVFSNEEE